MKIDDTWYDSTTALQVTNQTAQKFDGGVRDLIDVDTVDGTAHFQIVLEMYDGFPVLRYYVRYRNLKSDTAHVQWLNMVPWAFDDQKTGYTAFRVNQFHGAGNPRDFEPLQTALTTDGTPVEVYSGAHGDQCSWLVVKDTAGPRGVFMGWEFDGRTRTTVRQYGSDGYLQFASNVLDMNHPVAPGDEFQVPAAFIGVFHGDWDEAGYRTQRFVEKALAKPKPDKNFPYVGWDSWASSIYMDEVQLRRDAEIAAGMGVELFTVDLGWAREIGDWQADPQKFPSGLRALSDYVHSLGMKFGLHFALAEAAPDAPVLQDNPDWTSTEPDNYFWAVSLCLSHRPVRDWLVAQAVRMIDDYGVDWILQDGENMVKECTKTTHTHDPADSNYSNAVDGLNWVVSEIQRQRPNVLWENCENGGNMMTFNMVHNYVTSITNDATGAFQARLAAYGATFPFPPRYADRYMGDSGLTTYHTRSYMFGGPWIMMQDLLKLAPPDMALLRSEISVFKAHRGLITESKVIHLAQPDDSQVDAIQGYNPGMNAAVAVITRPSSGSDAYQYLPRGLNPSETYVVTFQSSGRSVVASGEELMRSGITVPLPQPLSAEIVQIAPPQAGL